MAASRSLWMWCVRRPRPGVRGEPWWSYRRRDAVVARGRGGLLRRRVRWGPPPASRTFMALACLRTCGETIFGVRDGLVSAAILLCSATSDPLVLAQVPPGDHRPGQCSCRLSDVVTARPYRQRVPVCRLIATSRQALELFLPCDTPDGLRTSWVGATATPDQAQVWQRPMDPPHHYGPHVGPLRTGVIPPQRRS